MVRRFIRHGKLNDGDGSLQRVLRHNPVTSFRSGLPQKAVVMRTHHEILAEPLGASVPQLLTRFISRSRANIGAQGTLSLSRLEDPLIVGRMTNIRRMKSRHSQSGLAQSCSETKNQKPLLQACSISLLARLRPASLSRVRSM
jgi:hypothetical protein